MTQRDIDFQDFARFPPTKGPEEFPGGNVFCSGSNKIGHVGKIYKYLALGVTQHYMIML